MIKEIIGVGDTLESAKADAVAQLGSELPDDYELEIIETPKKKTLGIFGGSPAKVKISIEVPDEKPARREKVRPEPVRREKAGKPQPVKVQPAAEKKEAKSENAVGGEKKAENKVTSFVPRSETIPADQIDPSSRLGKSIAYISEILSKLTPETVSITAGEIDGGYLISLNGESLGSIIGHRGETLDAIQYLASLKANESGGYVRIALNIGDYREKREEALRSLARRIAAQVIRTGRSRRLEPMNPYERRIIHTEIQGIDGVVSCSVNEGINRRVVISPENGGSRPSFDGQGRRGRDGRRGRSGGRPERPAVDPDRPARQDAGSFPLYGKIEK